MRILLKQEGNLIVAFDAVSGDELGVGITSNAAIGAAVRADWLSNGCTTVDDISSEDGLC